MRHKKLQKPAELGHECNQCLFADRGALGTALNILMSMGTIQTEVTVKLKVAQSYPTLCDPMDLYSPLNSPGQNTGVGSHFLLQRIFPIQELTRVSCMAGGFFYQLSYKGSPP